MKNQTKSLAVSANEGDAFWQPGNTKGNCITIKVSPWTRPETKHTVFLYELPKGGTVREHFHEIEEEIFICLEGEGIITIDSEEYSLKPQDVVYVAPFSKHSLQAISE